ncbi:hypothetical protein [Marinobacterium sp. BA1]|uniref:hypothetical protein n=1 Tax=Marinobacterium sp. BA1 TaxID=3138931 RepID=UPI0032E5D6DB
MIWQTLYQSAYGCVTWHGDCAQTGDELNGFLQGPVAARLHDSKGSEELSEHLQGLSLTGMGLDALQAVLDAELPETRDWAAGEALAEALLQDQHDVVLPWNNERDKRNPFASLPGADIVGFQRQGSSYRLALGEVKCSSEEKWPPQVMSGRSGMIHQLETLASHLGTLCQLLKWLLPRVKNTEYQPAFDAACRRYFESGNRDLALFGVLIRDQSASEMDLKNRGKALAKCVHAPTDCHLIALYLPWPIKQLPAVITQGGAT